MRCLGRGILRLGDGQCDRYELVRGKPRSLPCVQSNHNRIVLNPTRLFSSGLAPDAFEVATGDVALKVGEDSIRYADLMIVPAGKRGDIRFVEDARLVVEVLSRSTIHIDFGEKLDEYRRLEGLQTSMIISQKPAEVWIWSQGADGVWPDDPTVLTVPTSVLDIPDLDIAIALDEVYRNVT